MDVNDLRSAVTLLSLLLFIGLMTWTWWPRRQRAHEEAARLPFDGEAADPEDGAPQ
jgi:cytochrome c oxidase cbb3-type subunit 4